MTIATYDKDPSATLDYSIDWSAWLPSGDTIASATWTATAGLTVESSPAPSVASGIATAWLSGGTAGTRYVVTCQVTTAAGRVDERGITISVKHR